MSIESLSDANDTTVQTDLVMRNTWRQDFLQEFSQEFSIAPEQFTCPQTFTSVGDIFEQAKTVIRPIWSEVFARHHAKFQRHTSVSPSAAVGLQTLMFDQEEFKRVISAPIDEYWKLEELSRRGGEEIWLVTAQALSLQQRAINTLAKSWISGMSGEQCALLGYDKPTLQLYISLVDDVQEDVDAVFIAECEAEREPGGAQKTPYTGVDGSQFVYIDNDPKSTDYRKIRPLHERYSRLENISKTLRRHANTLPPTGFGGILSDLASALVSDETDFHKLEVMWTGISKRIGELNDCPIVISPPSFCNAKGQVVHDLLIGLRKPQSPDVSRQIAILTDIVATDAKRRKGLHAPVPIVYADIFTRNGASLAWQTSGFFADGFLLIVENESDALAARSYDRYSAILTDPVSLEQYKFARKMGLLGHELQHNANQLDGFVISHLGAGLPTNELDELNADAGSINYMRRFFKYPEATVSRKAFLQQYIIEYMEHLALGYGTNVDTSYAWYAFSGSVIIQRLFESGAIMWEGETVSIIDDQKGMEIFTKLQRRIIRMYRNYAVKQRDSSRLVHWLKKKSHTHYDTQRFIHLAAMLTGVENPNINMELLHSN